MGMPVCSLTIIANAVWWPCPCAEVPAITLADAVVVDLDSAVLAGATAGGDLDVRRHADAEQVAVAVGSALGLLAPQLVVAGQPGDGVERSACTRRCRR